jgi:hypothetical protein
MKIRLQLKLISRPNILPSRIVCFPIVKTLRHWSERSLSAAGRRPWRPSPVERSAVRVGSGSPWFSDQLAERPRTRARSQTRDLLLGEYPGPSAVLPISGSGFSSRTSGSPCPPGGLCPRLGSQRRHLKLPGSQPTHHWLPPGHLRPPGTWRVRQASGWRRADPRPLGLAREQLRRACQPTFDLAGTGHPVLATRSRPPPHRAPGRCGSDASKLSAHWTRADRSTAT